MRLGATFSLGTDFLVHLSQMPSAGLSGRDGNRWGVGENQLGEMEDVCNTFNTKGTFFFLKSLALAGLAE